MISSVSKIICMLVSSSTGHAQRESFDEAGLNDI